MDYLLIAASGWLDLGWWWAIAQVIIGLGTVIFVHELGHFLVAKACGVKCEKFYVGFDVKDFKIGDRVIIPKSLVKFQWGETEYGIGVVPLGGYVKMLGQDDNPSNMEEEIRRSMIDPDAEMDPNLPSGLVDKSKMDPRSFLAKSVPQRMAIISAGVIFNLIFAALFAAIAFRSGVFYSPPQVGDVTAGGPAWEEDLAGISLKKIGDRQIGSDYFTYMDVAQEIALNGEGNPLELEFTRPGSDEIESIEVLPQTNMIRRAADLPLIGIFPATTNVLGKEPTVPGNPAVEAEPALKGGDIIVEANGQLVSSGHDLRLALSANFDKPLNLVLERPGEKESDPPTRVSTIIGLNPMRELGIVMRWMPIAAIQKGSPASQAGFKVGDSILSIDGKPPGQLLTLDQRMTRAARDSKTVEFRVRRKNAASESEEIAISVVPRMPRRIPSVSENHPVGIDTLGLAIPSGKRIAAILPNSSAENAGLQPGDILMGFEFLLSDEQKKNEAYEGLVKKPKLDLTDKDENTTWAELQSLVQRLEIGTSYGVQVQRDEKMIAAEVKAAASEDFFLLTRGIQLTMLQDFYKSDDFVDCLRLGVRQTGQDASRVWKFLVKLVRGKISPTNLGGPGTIAMVATSEASESTSRLLLFLTLLSANLAIINFLPIPILDGGHMLFLAYEGLFRKPVTPQVQNSLMILGVVMLLSLMLFVLGLDTFRFLELF